MPAGELSWVTVPVELRFQIGHLKQFINPLTDTFFIPTQELGDNGDVFSYGFVREETDGLDDIAQTLPEFHGIHIHDVLVFDGDVSPGEGLQTVGQAQCRGLAAPRGPEKDHDLPLGDGETDIVEGRDGIPPRTEYLGDRFVGNHETPLQSAKQYRNNDLITMYDDS